MECLFEVDFLFLLFSVINKQTTLIDPVTGMPFSFDVHKFFYAFWYDLRQLSQRSELA